MTAIHLDDGFRRRRIAHRHRLRLPDRTDDVEQIVRSLVCLHSSDPATVFLSAMARMPEPDIGAVERALYEERTLIRHHAMRRTIFVFPVDLVADAHWSTTAPVARKETAKLARLLEDMGIARDGVAWMDGARREILSELDRRGTATTRELGRALPELAATIEVGGGRFSAHSRMVLLMGFEGSVVRNRPLGTWISSQYVWSTMATTFPGVIEPDRPLDPEESATRLTERYLEAFGPVTTKDLAWWTGWGITRARRALAAAGAIEVGLDAGAGWVHRDDDLPDPGPDDGSVVFLPGLDSTVMGWTERDFYLTPSMVHRLFDRNGNAGPTVWLDGRVVGGWVQAPDGAIEYELLEPGADPAHVRAEADRVARMYGDIRHRIRFPAPLQQERYA